MSDQKDPFGFVQEPARICEEHGLRAAVVVVALPDGSYSIAATANCGHAEVNHMLSLGIHMNLTDHDRQVLAGAAGPEAKAQAEAIHSLNEVH